VYLKGTACGNGTYIALLLPLSKSNSLGIGRVISQFFTEQFRRATKTIKKWAKDVKDFFIPDSVQRWLEKREAKKAWKELSKKEREEIEKTLKSFKESLGKDKASRYEEYQKKTYDIQLLLYKALVDKKFNVAYTVQNPVSVPGLIEESPE